jgi:D-glycero-alpha-D-manno-heptose-7-phosphate kinase
MIITRTPLRLSLGGGGTDLYNWYKKNGSFLITATINKFIYVTISERKILKDFWLSYSTIENEKNKKNIRHSIIRKVLEKYNIKKGLEVHTVSEVPSNSGLGSSGSLTVGFIKALSTFFKRKISNKDLAEEACNVEMVLNKKNSGKQDQYAAAVGGFVILRIKKNGSTTCERLKISKKRIKKLEKNLFLVFVKQQRFTVNILKKQSKIINKNKSKANLMSEIQKIAYKSKRIFETGNIDEIGPVFDYHWQLKKNFGDFMSNNKIDKLYNKLKKYGATGGKIIGAGGGGFLMMYVPENNILKFKKIIKKNKIDYLDWKFHNKNSEVIFNDKES